MNIIKTSIVLNRYLNTIRETNTKVTIGFIPTMGALHSGHTSLINASVKNNDITVCSIFVNPTQFGDSADLEKYPKPIEKDIEVLLKNECDVLFLPSNDTVYPNDYTQKSYDLNDLDLKIEGASRPGHFQGVCNVVGRFFEIVKPDNAYFGQKDYQQTVVVNRLIQITNSSVKLNVVPIKRESHGLAMSSRNIRLSEKGRQNAAFIYRSLVQLKEDISNLGLEQSVKKARQFIQAQKGAHVDYLLAVDSITLEPVKNMEDSKGIAVVTVVEYEGVRLLDNIILK
ncbi:MAG: pantoate--beta-alanine ligase [Bacteroidetes bacterium]|nr:MAG: pantoate--beta-alanine ligase [Bacteroidota bacterium]